MSFESQLKGVLQRVEPPPGFADRVMKLCGGQPSGWRVPARGPAATLFRALAAAALIAVAVGGWGVYATLRARDELLTAMRIASQKVVHAQQEVNRR